MAIAAYSAREYAYTHPCQRAKTTSSTNNNIRLNASEAATPINRPLRCSARSTEPAAAMIRSIALLTFAQSSC